ncbi:retrovirus-related Pol polyprotein from transposon opus [Trichonephila clavipes]|nr:retrovirus-related Pol polyprotein from transposon opus [Trichonephila clavipes]
MEDISAVKIPAFVSSDPALWFGRLESTFELAVPKPIIDERTKYNYCVAHLSPDAAMAVQDVTLSPGSTYPYSKLKDEVIARCGESKKPGNSPTFSRKAARRQKAIGIISTQKTSEETPVQVSTVSKYSSANSDDSRESKLLKELKLLRQEVKELRRSRSFSRNRLNSRNCKKSPKPTASNLCWYYNKFSMYSALIFPGKLERAGVVATYALPSSSSLLFVRNRKSNICFLVHTGGDCSILPANKTQKQSSPVQTFIVANDTPIQVYRRKLINSNIFSIKTHAIDDDFSKLLNDFPNIVKPPCANQTVVHHIDIFGPPVCAKPRRMAPDRLKIAKMEFQHMLDLGHMRQSSSNYSSPLHIVPKKKAMIGALLAILEH